MAEKFLFLFGCALLFFISAAKGFDGLPIQTGRTSLTANFEQNNLPAFTALKRAYDRGDHWVERVDYYDPQGNPILKEKTIVKANGLDLISYDADKPGAKEAYIRNRNGRFTLTVKKEAQEEPEETSISWNDQTVLMPTLPVFLIRHKDRLLSGEAIDFEMLIPDMKRKVTLTAKQITSHESNSDRLVIRVHSDSWFMKMLVDPMFVFTFSSKPPHRVLQYRGIHYIPSEFSDLFDTMIITFKPLK